MQRLDRGNPWDMSSVQLRVFSVNLRCMAGYNLLQAKLGADFLLWRLCFLVAI